MKRSLARYAMIRLFLKWQLLALCAVLSVSSVLAQTADSEPPVVGLDGTREAWKGEAQVFVVTATDNEGVDSLVFHYRLKSDVLNNSSDTESFVSPDDEYASGFMSRIGQTDRYTYTIEAEDIATSVDTVEYYIEAKDEAGNRTLQGFFFDPLKRALVVKPVASLADNTAVQSGSTSLLGSLNTTEKVLFGALGVVVVAAVISAVGGGNGNDDVEADPTQTLVPVTIVTTTP